MDIEEVKKVFNSGVQSEIEDLSQKILGIENTDQVKVLCEDLDFFRQSIGNLETKATKLYRTNYKYRWAHVLLKYLERISSGGCRCCQYTLYEASPFKECKKGLVNIIPSRDSENGNGYLDDVICECTICKRRYVQESHDHGHVTIRDNWRFLPEAFYK